MEKRAFEYFKRSPLIHVDMAEAIRRGNSKILYADSDGVLLYNEKTHTYLLSSANYEAAVRLCTMVKGECRCIVVRGEGAAEAVKAVLNFELGEPCFQCAYLKKEPVQFECDGDIRPLDLSHIPTVARHYRITDPAYARDRIAAGDMFGLFNRETGEMMGFIGIHDDGSGGMLEIFEPYRKRGYGTALERFILNEQLRRGYTPYGQIFISNTKSINLQRKLGMEISTETLRWTFLKNSD
ncbi:MAG: GNAT family N-acetyltransferase [Clostridia bacterium]|nr:GNAT family N-acetyltransferase [Clostridia bacterium]